MLSKEFRYERHAGRKQHLARYPTDSALSARGAVVVQTRIRTVKEPQVAVLYEDAEIRQGWNS
jgi:hypothetical protein